MNKHPAVLALLCGACIVTVVGCANNAPTQPNAPRLAVYIASDEESATYFMPRQTPDGRSIFISSEPILTEYDVASFQMGEFAGAQPTLVLDLTNAGTHRLRNQAEEYVGREFVVIWNHEVVSVPRIMNPLSSQIAIAGSEWLSARELQTMIEYLSDCQLAAANSS